MPDKINLQEALARVRDCWRPRIIAGVNDAHVKLVKLKGSFVWHRHDAEDELFLVLAGRLLLQFRDGDVWLDPGECIVVPRGVEHCPVAPEEAHVLLFEPATTSNTGNVRGERTVEAEWLS